MKLRQTRKKNMKTKVLLLGAVVTAFAFTSFAADSLLTPRAKEAKINSVMSSVATPNITVTYVDSTSALLTPRAQANQTKLVKGTANDLNAALECRKTMVGSPKAVAECSSHTTMPGCMTIAESK